MITKKIALSLIVAVIAIVQADEPCCDRCCRIFVDRPVSDDKVLCRIETYVGHYALTQDQCPEGIFHVRMNKIRGTIGDSNMDANVDLIDFIDFVTCLESMDKICICPFDYDCDGDVNLKDFAGFQIGFGTGNASWLKN